MHDLVLNFLMTGFVGASWWQIVLFTLVMTHITIAAVTIFLHRAQAHRALELGALPSHFFRFWLWLTTGMVTKEWVAIHRKHHAKCETKDDPHSPVTHGIKTVLLQGSELYREAAATMPVRLHIPLGRSGDRGETELEHYGQGTPDDWIECRVYSRLKWHGIGLMFIIDFLSFGAIGVTVWAVQMLWIPVTAAGIINGLGHWWGYRNFETVAPDASTNISPWGIIIGGEELHNNHHTYPTSAKLSVRPWEFDIGWVYIRAMEILGLAKVRRTHLPPKPIVNWARTGLLISQPEPIVALRYEVAARLKEWAVGLKYREPQVAQTVEHFLKRFQDLWLERGLTSQVMLERLQSWCDELQQSGVEPLQRLASELPGWEVRR